LFVLEKKEKEVLGLASLFKSIIADGVITIDQFASGFKKVLSELGDFVIDLPKSPKYMSILLAHGIAGGYLPDTILNRTLDHLPKLSTSMAVDFFNALGELGNEDLSEKELFEILGKFFKEKKDEAFFVNFVTEQKLTFLFPTLTVRTQIESMLKEGQPQEEIVKWIHHNTPDLQIEETLARWLMRTVLKECWSKAATTPLEKRIEETGNFVKQYAKVLIRILSDNIDIQLACVFEVQAFVHSVQFPKGLISHLFCDLYDNDVILEDVFKQWKEDLHDPTPGKDKAIIETTKWLTWLEEAEEESDEESPAS